MFEDGSCRQRKYRVELFPKSFPKGGHKSKISIGDNGHWKAIIFPNMFKEELGSMVPCRSLLSWYDYNHLGESLKYY